MLCVTWPPPSRCHNGKPTGVDDQVFPRLGGLSVIPHHEFSSARYLAGRPRRHHPRLLPRPSPGYQRGGTRQHEPDQVVGRAVELAQMPARSSGSCARQGAGLSVSASSGYSDHR